VICVLYKEINILKSTGVSNDNFRYPCSICDDEHKNNRHKIFGNLDTLERHVRASHSDHPSYRAIKLLIKNLRIALDIGMLIAK
jgi:hypothetical protein